nr:uncharacterized protein LOC117681063 [Crassostrea gigas]
MNILFTSLWTVLLLGRMVRSQQLQRRDILNYLLNSSAYDARIAPDYEKDVATEVDVQLFVTSIDSINAISMDYSMNVFFATDMERLSPQLLSYQQHQCPRTGSETYR